MAVYSTTTLAERYAMLGPEGRKQHGPHLEALCDALYFPNGRPGKNKPAATPPPKKPEPHKKPRPIVPPSQQSLF